VNTLLDVKKNVRSIVGDDDAEWTSDDYLLPKINFAYRTQTLYIKAGSGTNLERVVEVPAAVDANGNSTTQGLTSMAEFQQTGGLLEGLYEPLFVWWKIAGSPVQNYRECYEKKTLPFTTGQVTNYATRMYFTWRGSQLFVTPINTPIDILVDGRFNPPYLTKDEDVLVAHPDMETTLTPATLAIIGTESGNTGWQQMGAQQATDAADNIVAQIIRSKQGYTARAGSMSRCNRRGWYWG
jgi:hypothetical protein